MLALAPPGTAWVWVVLGLHMYGLVFLLGIYASLVTRPHVMGADTIGLHAGVFTELIVCRDAIVDARLASEYAAKWFKLDEAHGIASLAYGDANIHLILDTDRPIRLNGRSWAVPVPNVYLTADDPEALLAALHQARAHSPTRARGAVGAYDQEARA